MAATTKQPPAGPPQRVDVRKYTASRATELHSLHSLISTRLNGDFRSHRHTRRRTTCHLSKNHRCKRKRPKTESDEKESIDKEKKLPRRVRRRIELKKNTELGFGVSIDGSKRLRTHVWYAKRFRMAKLWGFYLPLGLHGRGEGSRALLKWYKQGTVVHDASYYTAVQLEGPEESLLSILNMLLMPSPIDQSQPHFKSILSGDTYGSAMLHHDGQDVCKSICPVTYMWQPYQQENNGVGAEDKRTDENVQTDSCAHFRRLWIWMHPSAFAQGFDCLKLLCQKKTNETGVLIDCVSLEGQLAKFEVFGLRAFQLLQKLLLPFDSSLDALLESKSNLNAVDQSGCDIQQKDILEKAECLSTGAAIPLMVTDPRLLSVKKCGSVTESHSTDDHCVLTEENALSSVHSTFESSANCKDLWMVSEGVCPPLEEKFVCLERRKKSLDFFHIKDKTSAQVTPNVPQFSKVCPIVLLKNAEQAGHLTGWSIILPLSWAKAFWIPLVSGGAHAIGLREKHWIAGDVGLPSFPSDFPDSDAYSSFMATEAAEVAKKWELRPVDMRPVKVPIPPPWSKILSVFELGVKSMNEVGTLNNLRNSGDHSTESSSKSSACPPVSDSREVFVARTSKVLTCFLKEIGADNLLLFPKGHDRKSFSHIMKDDAMICQGSDVASLGSRICYVRVLLHAYKEGVMDEGAVICAPRLSDLSLWISGFGNNKGGLQVPHAYVGSYFKELSSGNWDFDLPEDPAAKEAYRRPIGFVTSGFVRGSKKPSAVGLCEATLVASLRREQWSHVTAKKRKKEIYVLVRNLRSTAYRLALATIVLEGQVEDVISM